MLTLTWKMLLLLKGIEGIFTKCLRPVILPEHSLGKFFFIGKWKSVFPIQQFHVKQKFPQFAPVIHRGSQDLRSSIVVHPDRRVKCKLWICMGSSMVKQQSVLHHSTPAEDTDFSLHLGILLSSQDTTVQEFVKISFVCQKQSLHKADHSCSTESVSARTFSSLSRWFHRKY